MTPSQMALAMLVDPSFHERPRVPQMTTERAPAPSLRRLCDAPLCRSAEIPRERDPAGAGLLAADPRRQLEGGSEDELIVAGRRPECYSEVFQQGGPGRARARFQPYRQRDAVRPHRAGGRCAGTRSIL